MVCKILFAPNSLNSGKVVEKKKKKEKADKFKKFFSSNKRNKTIVNLHKFQTIVLYKKRSDLTKTKFHLDNQVIKLVSFVKILRIQIDDKLNFNPHISKICKSAANELNALIRL